MDDPRGIVHTIGPGPRLAGDLTGEEARHATTLIPAGQARPGLAVYPVCLVKLQHRLCLVVGGGHVAAGKVRRLLDAQARVRVLAPTVVPPLARLARQGQLEWTPRSYRHGDLAGAWLVIAATGDGELNAAIAEEARARDILFNAVDDLRHCTFIAPSVVRREGVLIAISTSGQAPALAVRLRERVERLLGEGHGALAQELGRLRPRVTAAIPELAPRRRAWYALADAGLAWIEGGGSPSLLRETLHAVLRGFGVLEPPPVGGGEHPGP